jgi:hypothetical protein
MDCIDLYIRIHILYTRTYILCCAVAVLLLQLLLLSHRAYELCDDNVSWFRSCLTNGLMLYEFWAPLSAPFAVFSGVQQGLVPGPLLCNAFINNICNVTKYSRYLLFADDNNFRVIISAEDCTVLQSGVVLVSGWRLLTSWNWPSAKLRLLPS